MAYKIYTKGGDKGKTSLIGGSRVDKNDQRVQAYGDIDEAKSNIGLIHDLTDDKEIKAVLKEIIIKLFTIESLVASDSQESRDKMPQIYDTDIEFLENQIDIMEKNLEPLKNFILPIGHKLISQTHISRTICRRAERKTILAYPSEIDLIITKKYLNRLSDYLFVLARYFAKINDIKDIKWK